MPIPYYSAQPHCAKTETDNERFFPPKFKIISSCLTVLSYGWMVRNKTKVATIPLSKNKCQLRQPGPAAEKRKLQKKEYGQKIKE